MEGELGVECYKCFSLGYHRCYQNFTATKEFVCENCGNLKSPFQLIKDQNSNDCVICFWCNKNLTGKDIAELQHILACPERKIHNLNDFLKYQCICAKIALQEKWLLLK